MKWWKATFRIDDETVARIVKAEDGDAAMDRVWDRYGARSVMVEEVPEAAVRLYPYRWRM